MDWENYLRTLFALIAVLAAIVALTWFLKRANIRRFSPGAGKKRRLSVQESLMLDGKRRLVLVRRDNMEHLLLIGGERDIALESPIVDSGAIKEKTGEETDA